MNITNNNYNKIRCFNNFDHLLYINPVVYAQGVVYIHGVVYVHKPCSYVQAVVITTICIVTSTAAKQSMWQWHIIILVNFSSHLDSL